MLTDSQVALLAAIGRMLYVLVYLILERRPVRACEISARLQTDDGTLRKYLDELGRLQVVARTRQGWIATITGRQLGLPAAGGLEGARQPGFLPAAGEPGGRSEPGFLPAGTGENHENPGKSGFTLEKNGGNHENLKNPGRYSWEYSRRPEFFGA